MLLLYTRIDSTVNHLALEPALLQFPQAVRETIRSYVFPQDAAASLLGRLLVLKGLEQAGLDVRWADMGITEKDRPFLPGSSWDFNISHAGDYVVAILAKERVGIDIERFRKVRLEIFNRQFSEAEWAIIHSSPQPELQFIKFWSIKEAAIKADGRGVAVLSQTRILDEQRVSVEESVKYYAMPEIAEGYSCSICTESLSTSFSSQFISVQNLLKSGQAL